MLPSPPPPTPPGVLQEGARTEVGYSAMANSPRQSTDLPVPHNAGRRRRILHPDPKHRLSHDPSIDTFEPVVPPAQALLKEADLRARFGEMRVFVRPWPDQPFFRPRQILEQPEHRIRIAVGPTANRIDGTSDGAPVLTDRAVAVEGVAPLMAQPLLDPEPASLEAIHPQLPPALADQDRIGRGRVQGEHRRTPGKLVEEEAAAHEMDVVGITIVCRADRDDGRELGGRRAAICRPLKPPQEMPIIPTLPVHQDCCANQASTSSASSCSC